MSAVVTGYSKHACFIAHPIHSNINTQDLYIVSRAPSYCCRCARQSIAEDFLHGQCSYDARHMYLPFCQECQSQDCQPSMINFNSLLYWIDAINDRPIILCDPTNHVTCARATTMPHTLSTSNLLTYAILI